MTKEAYLEELLCKAQIYFSENSLKKIERAYYLADKAHKGQFRKSNRPFIFHPVQVAIILCELEQDYETVMAGLLHDTIEDTDISNADIEKYFGKDVSKLVDGVTKLNRLKFHSRQEAQVENYRKLFLSMADDYRVIIIKLADRLHNMRTLQFLPALKQQRIAKETLDIYAPLANKLGINTMKWQLEDLAFSYINPEKYQETKEMLAQTRAQRESYLEDLIGSIKKVLKKLGLKAETFGRPKHIYSISQKLDKKNSSIDELYDLLGVRIVVDDVAGCYGVLGAIHSHFRPIPDRFKDYIALPKSNGYQSLHTAIITESGKFVEIQIRTTLMHHTSEFGFAAHWQYKKGTKSKKVQGELKWLQSIIEHNDEKLAPNDFLQTLKFDLYADEVFVFTPKGDVKSLSRGSTILDFAYSSQTEVGHRCKGALVNGKIVPLSYELKSGDQSEILTSKTSEPKVDWLRIVHSRHTRYKIKQYLNSKTKKDLLVSGAERIKKVFFSEGLIFEQAIQNIDLKAFYDRFQLDKVDDVFVYVEQGDISSMEVVRYVKKQIEKTKSPDLKIKKPVFKKRSDNVGIYILGETNIKFTLAKCCMPVPGDEISGIVVIGKGVSVHRCDCKNIVAVKKESPERLIEVSWDSSPGKKLAYTCTFRIEGYDREGLLQDLLSIIYSEKINLKEVRTKVSKDNTNMSATISIDITNIKQFYELKRKLSDLEDVYSVYRLNLGLES